MNERKVHHGTIVVPRIFEASPARVFAAWADPAARARWDVPGGDWEIAQQECDFRVGGHEVKRFGPPGDPIYLADTRYADIVPDERIVFAYTMDRGETRISASLTTVELQPAGAGTRLTLTEQAAFLDGGDQPEYREQGWKAMLGKLDAALRRERATAAARQPA
jgi:uncharacterized protein YndB with AHSA1/START domain